MFASGRERLAALRKAGLHRPTTPEPTPTLASEQAYAGRASTSLEPPELSIPLPCSPLPPLPNSPMPQSPMPPSTPVPEPAFILTEPRASDQELMTSILTDLDALHAHPNAASTLNFPQPYEAYRRSSTSVDLPAHEQFHDITTDLSHDSDRNSLGSTISTLVEDPMAEFFTEIEALQDLLQSLNGHIGRISELHARALNHPAHGAEQDSYSDELAAVIETTVTLSAVMKDRIKALQLQTSKFKGRPSDIKVRKSQTGLIKSRFMESLQVYQEVERQYRSRYKQRLERQFLIVNPEASAEEVRAVVDNTQSGQIFAQALMSTNRNGESRAALSEVQARHEDIRRIEETLCELAKMFQDMADLVEQQDETVTAIEAKAAGIEKDTEVALGYTTGAVNSARAARKKRWICFALAGVILLIFIIAIVASIKPAHHDAPAAKAKETKAAPADDDKKSKRSFGFDDTLVLRDSEASMGIPAHFVNPRSNLIVTHMDINESESDDNMLDMHPADYDYLMDIMSAYYRDRIQFEEDDGQFEGDDDDDDYENGDDVTDPYGEWE